MTNDTEPPISLPHVTPKLQCRYYEEKIPATEDVIVAKVYDIGDIGAYASLLEYDNRDGLILMSELSRRRIRSVNKLIRIGREEYVLVTRADSEKGYIDLSKRRTTQEDHQITENRYQKAKCVYSIVKHTATMLEFQTNEQLEDLMSRTAWYLNRKYKKEGETQKASYDIFKKAVEDPSVLDECELNEKERSILLRNIKHRMMPTLEKIRADITVSCTGPDGVDAVKEALKAGIQVAKEHADGDNDAVEKMPLSITLIAPPEYVVITQNLDKEKGIQQVKESIKAIQEKIATFKYGVCKIKVEPRVVGAQDEDDLKSALEAAAAANRQIDGDDDEDEE